MNVWSEGGYLPKKKPGEDPGVLSGTTPPVTPLPGSLPLTPGYTPDYGNLILSDPAYLTWRNNSQLELAKAAAQRKAAIDALIVQYGGAGQFKDAYGDVNQQTLDAAKSNQYSDVARLQRSYEQGVEQFKRQLSARGMLSSGDLGYGLDQAELQRQTSEYDLGNEFMSAVNRAIGGYSDTESLQRQLEQQAIQAAEQSVYSNPMNRPTEGTSATLDPDWMQKYGHPVYVGPDGRLYNADGSAYSAPAAPPQQPSSQPNLPPNPGTWWTS